mgnify:CR=1 FL=1
MVKYGEVKLENPLFGGDLGVGKSVIRDIFTEISRPLSSWKRGKGPTPNPSQEGNNCAIVKYMDLS